MRWDWELKITLRQNLPVSVFVVPRVNGKGRKYKRIVVCNSVAQSIVDCQRGLHEERVFTYWRPRKECDKADLLHSPMHWIKPSLKLNSVETAFLREAADQADMSISAFIRFALQSHLTKTASLNNEEVTALYQSNFQLLRIGRNLNQIARACNAQEPIDLTSQKITEVMDMIDDHIRKVRDLIVFSQERLQ